MPIAKTIKHPKPLEDMLVVATGNQGKLKEITQIVSRFNIRVISQKELGVSEAEETGLTFIENAILKARQAARQTGYPALADDSGLEVDALDGRPGIYSARFAGQEARDSENNAKLLQLLDGIPPEQRTARFQCLMVYLRHHADPAPIICQGVWEGRIATTPSGNNGFGYDPLFLVAGENCTAAELPKERKNRLSHRGQALRQLLTAFELESNE